MPEHYWPNPMRPPTRKIWPDCLKTGNLTRLSASTRITRFNHQVAEM